MDFHRFNLKLCASVAFAAGVAACCAQTPTDQSAILSKPADDGTAGPASSLQLPQDSSLNPSLPGFNNSPNLNFPIPPPDANAVWQKELNNRRNWTLMTPEEIMGVQTPEQIFGLTERDPEKNLSLEERYLKRESNAEKAAEKAAATNTLAGGDVFSHNGLFDQPDANDPVSSDSKKDQPDGSGVFSRIFGTSQDSLFGQKTRASQFNPGTSAAAAAKAQLEEDAEMARFRALIGEVPQPGTSTPTPSPALASSPSLQPVSQFDPFGHPLISQASDPSKPTELMPMTEFTGYYTPPKKTKKPSWEAQPPPWLSESVTPPTGPPVRKFY
jgi:hypothetical protein